MKCTVLATRSGHTLSPCGWGRALFRTWPVRLPIPAVLILALVITTGGGCDLPERPLLKPVKDTTTLPTENPLNESDLARLEPPTEMEDPAWDTWDAYFVNNRQVGYSHMRAGAVGSKQQGYVRIGMDHRIYQQQGNARILQRLRLNSQESRDGRLVSFDATSDTGLAVVKTVGTVDEEGNLVIASSESSAGQIRQISWEQKFRGFFAVEQSLRNQPMRIAGETRAIKFLVPGQFELATVELRCSGKALVPMLDGSEAELIEINTEIKLDSGETIYTAIWTDSVGNLVRTYSAAMDLISYRTDQATATLLADDNLVPLSIQLTGELQRPAETTRVAYRLSALSPEMTINPAPGQYVRATADGNLEVLVSRQAEQPAAEFAADESTPDDGDRRNNFFIDSRSALITKLAGATVVEDDQGKAEIAAALTASAHEKIQFNPQRAGLAKASDVAQSGEAGAVEFAVLLAALMRSRNIPARIVVGLRYDRDTPGQMVGHAWTLAYIDDRWLHFDAVDGTAAASDRIIFAASNLSQRDENKVFDPLLQNVGKMAIEIVAAKY